MKKILVFLFPFFLLFSCSSSKGFFEDADGIYTYQIVKGNGKGAPILKGMTYQNHPRSAELCLLGINHKIVCNGDAKGCQVAIEAGQNTIIANTWPFPIIETKPIKVNAGDTLKIIFYLNQHNYRGTH